MQEGIRQHSDEPGKVLCSEAGRGEILRFRFQVGYPADSSNTEDRKALFVMGYHCDGLEQVNPDAECPCDKIICLP